MWALPSTMLDLSNVCLLVILVCPGACSPPGQWAGHLSQAHTQGDRGHVFPCVSSWDRKRSFPVDRPPQPSRTGFINWNCSHPECERHWPEERGHHR